MANSNLNILTGKVRASFVRLLQKDEQSDKYCVTLLVPKSDRKTYQALMDEVQRVAKAYKAKGGKRAIENLHNIHDGDAPTPKGSEYGPECKGCWVLRVSNQRQPKCFDRNGTEIIDLGEIYSGCYVRALIHGFAYDKNGNVGIGFTLDGLQKWADGEPLGGHFEADAGMFADGYTDPDGDDYGLD